jgi:hypothetical protein
MNGWRQQPRHAGGPDGTSQQFLYGRHLVGHIEIGWRGTRASLLGILRDCLCTSFDLIWSVNGAWCGEKLCLSDQNAIYSEQHYYFAQSWARVYNGEKISNS